MYTAAVGDENPPIPISARLHRRRLWNADSRQLDGSGRSSLGHQCSRSTRLYYGARALCLTRITNNNNPPLKTKTKYADPLSFLFYVWSFLSILKKKKKIVFFFCFLLFFPYRFVLRNHHIRKSTPYSTSIPTSCTHTRITIYILTVLYRRIDSGYSQVALLTLDEFVNSRQAKKSKEKKRNVFLLLLFFGRSLSIDWYFPSCYFLLLFFFCLHKGNTRLVDGWLVRTKHTA